MNVRVIKAAGLAFALLALMVAAVDAAQYQRAQIGVLVTVNVTPGPFGMRAGRTIAYGPGETRSDVLRPPVVVAQATAQAAVPVIVNITPNPRATLFYSNVPSITLNATAGTTVQYACPFTLTLGTPTVISWTIDAGLSADFIDASNWNGNTLSESFRQGGTPNQGPFSAFVVYPDNANQPVPVKAGGYAQTYCIDLQLQVPVTVRGGVYSTTAIYTLFY